MSVDVSIVMAVYNGADFLAEQIDSILAQTVQNFELVIVDDASSDSSVEIIESYLRIDKRIKLFKQSKNSGFLSAFQSGIHQSTGTYISLVDQDDIWLSNHLQLLLSKIGTSSLAFSDSHMLYGTEKTQIKFSSFINIPDLHRQTDLDIILLFRNFVRGANCIFHVDLKKQILPFPKNLLFHDHWIAYHANQIRGIVFIDVVTSYYRRHAGTITNENSGLCNKFKKFQPWSFPLVACALPSHQRFLRKNVNIDLSRIVLSKHPILSVVSFLIILVKYYSLIFSSHRYFKVLIIPFSTVVFIGNIFKRAFK